MINDSLLLLDQSIVSSVCPIEWRRETLTRQLVYKRDKEWIGTGGDIETSSRFRLTENVIQCVCVCVVIWMSAAVCVRWLLRGLTFWLIRDWERVRRGWVETMGGRIQSKTRNAYFPTYSPNPSGPIARKEEELKERTRPSRWCSLHMAARERLFMFAHILKCTELRTYYIYIYTHTAQRDGREAHFLCLGGSLSLSGCNWRWL